MSGRQARSRRPISSNAAVNLARWSRGIVSQSRAMIGPWLAAKIPTSLAMADLRRRGGAVHRVQSRHELVLRHAADLKIKTQQVGIDQRRQCGDVVVHEGATNVRLDPVALD